ncbi:hypothetical protein N9O54_01920 [Schleiferiaceae bacterium]|nr:hypothetical protein [Schleiferiaceae bacterium]
MKKWIKWFPVVIALVALLYSVSLGLTGYTTEAQYTSHWPGTLLLFYLVIEKIRS